MTVHRRIVVWLALLLLMPIASLHQPARAYQDEAGASDEDRKKEMFPAFDSGCERPAKGAEYDYPFSVARVIKAYAVAKKKARKIVDVNVIVVDNGFVGYQESGFSANFPEQFFAVDEPDDERLAAPPPGTEGRTLALWGHGTHIVGLLLGGDYDEEKSVAIPPIFAPGVRKLLQRGAENQSWLSVYVVRVGNQNLELGDIKELDQKLKQLEGLPAKSEIINMSIIDVDPTDAKARNLPLFNGGSTLFIAAAGNATDNLSKGGGRYPAQARGGNLLVVGSHDADGELSKFSNYGAAFVEIAAPGCQIRSWLRGEGGPTPLDGTSFSTAIVSFAASLVRSVNPDYDPPDLKTRLLLSARYNPKLLNCKKDSDEPVEVMPGREIDARSGCVRYGNQLDIVAALLADFDMVEYCADGTASCSRPAIAYGMLSGVPASVGRCFSGAAAATLDELKLPPLKLRADGAIRRVEGGYQALYLSADGAIHAKVCAKGENDGQFVLGSPMSLEEGNAMPSPLVLEPQSVLRVVTRSKL